MAPVTEPAWRRAGLVLCAHGIAGGPGAAARHAAAIARRGLFAEVRACALRGRPTPAEAIGAMAGAELHIVPFLMADGHLMRQVLPRALAELGGGRRIVLHRPVGDDPRLAALLEAKARTACARRGWRAADTALLLIGHGTPRAARSRASAEAQAARIAAAGRFALCEAAFLKDAPGVPETLARLDGRRCVAVGLFAEAGPHGSDDVRRLLAAAGDAVVYAGPVGPDPRMAEVILDHLRTAGALVAA